MQLETLADKERCGTLRSDTPHAGTLYSGTLRSGTPRSGTLYSGTLRSDTPRSGTMFWDCVLTLRVNSPAGVHPGCSCRLRYLFQTRAIQTRATDASSYCRSDSRALA